MLKIKTLDKSKIYSIIFGITCIFLIMQPFFDLLSYLHIRGFLPFGISTYAKPLIIGLINLSLLILYKKQIWQCAITYGGYIILMIVHTILMDGMLIATATILHELRFMINILYLLLCYHNMRILYEEADDKEVYVSKLKRSLIAAFALYIALYLISVASGTASMTYEYSDYLKQGYKGWMDSGQIFGHTLCICLPFMICTLLNAKFEKPIVRIICKIGVILPILVLSMIGTKVSYYIAILVLVIQVFLELFFTIKEKKKSHIINAIVCAIIAATCILAYPITPVKQNTDINDSVLSNQPDKETLAAIIENEKDKHSIKLDKLEKPSKDKLDKTDKDDEDDDDQTDDTSYTGKYWAEAIKNATWTDSALAVLEQKYADGELHPSDMRDRQLYFNWEKFKLADFKYKVFGIGYINQGDMAIERDVLCVLFSFGLFGFVLVLLRPIILWFRAAFIMIRRFLKADISDFCLFEGFSMFFFISWYAGATFIYTNFAVFLSVIMCLLTYSVNKLKNIGKCDQ